MQELDDYINKVKQLPPAPRVLPQLLELLRDENSDANRVVSLITFDPSLTAAVLQVCNGAAYGLAQPATSVQDAVTHLGFRELYRIVAAVCGARALAPRQKGYGINEGELWRHSVATAVAAQLIAADKGDEEEVAFTAALLHDIGKTVLAQALEHIYSKLVEEVDKHQQSMLETEKKLLGVQHAEIGGRLLARWKFPPNLVSAVWFHHNPAAAEPHQKLAAYVYLGNMIAYFLGQGYGHQAFALRARAEALEILELRTDDIPRYMIRACEQFEAVDSLFHLATPTA